MQQQRGSSAQGVCLCCVRLFEAILVSWGCTGVVSRQLCAMFLLQQAPSDVREM